MDAYNRARASERSRSPPRRVSSPSPPKRQYTEYTEDEWRSHRYAEARKKDQLKKWERLRAEVDERAKRDEASRTEHQYETKEITVRRQLRE